MQKKVTIYTKDPCPYCVRAIQFMNNRGIIFEEIDLTGQEEQINQIKQKTGWRTVPIILIGEQVIGGYTDLKALEDEGKLDELLHGSSTSSNRPD